MALLDDGGSGVMQRMCGSAVATRRPGHEVRDVLAKARPARHKRRSWSERSCVDHRLSAHPISAATLQRLNTVA